jgi:hypothetical protein
MDPPQSMGVTKQAIKATQDEARRLRHAQVFPGHLFLGMLDWEGTLQRTLTGLGLTKDRAS